MPRLQLDPHFARVASRLDKHTLQKGALERLSQNQDDDTTLDTLFDPTVTPLFLGMYSCEGIAHAVHEYGIDAMLKQIGLGDYEFVLDCDDPYHHRLRAFLRSSKNQDGAQHFTAGQQILEMRMYRPILQVGDETLHALEVEWLLMQNPLAHFSSEKPRLPGQQHPGTGLGKVVNNLITLMGLRLGLDVVVNHPEHFHLAYLYHRAGYRHQTSMMRRRFRNVLAACKGVPLAISAWAAERGFIEEYTGDDTVGTAWQPWHYRADEMFLPLNDKARHALFDHAQHPHTQLAAGTHTTNHALNHAINQTINSVVHFAQDFWIQTKKQLLSEEQPEEMQFRVNVAGILDSLRTQPVSGCSEFIVPALKSKQE